MNCKITVINDIRHITLFFRMICMDGQNIIRAGLAQWAHSGTEAGVCRSALSSDFNNRGCYFERTARVISNRIIFISRQPNCQTFKLSNLQSVKLLNCQTIRLSDCQTYKLSNDQTVRLTNCQMIRLSDCPIVKLSNCQPVKPHF